MNLNVSPTRRRKFFQISMRSLLIGVTLCCFAFGMIWNWVNRSIAQRESVRTLERNQVWIQYDYEVSEDPVLNQLFSEQPSKIGRWLGRDFAHHVKRVVFQRKATGLELLVDFEKLDYLSFNSGLEDKDDWRTVCQISSLKQLRIDADAEKVRPAFSLSTNQESDLTPLLDNLHQLQNLEFLQLNCQGVPPDLLQPIFKHPELDELHLHSYGKESVSVEYESHPDSPTVLYSVSPWISKLHLVFPTHDSSSIERIFQAVPNLRQLSIHCSIEGEKKLSLEVLDGLSRFSQLNEIFLFAVDLRKLPESWSEIPLKRLGIGFCHLGDEGLEVLERMDQIEYLQLNHTAITDRGLDTILKVKNLRVLSIIDTRVTDEGLLRLAESTNLGVIRIRDTLVTKEGIEKFRKRNPKCELIE